jgi:siroheme synthase, N-terminal domain
MTVANTLYPAFLQLRDRKVVVVGGGTVAERKVRSLLSAGAQVHVMSPTLSPTLKQWSNASWITWIPSPFAPDALENAWLVIAATDDERINERVKNEAEYRHVWVNVVDDPALSAFHVPAVIDRSPIAIAISSGGYAPVIARRLREHIESLVEHSIGALATALATRREAIQRSYPDLTQRRRFYEWALDGPASTLFRDGRHAEGEAQLDVALQQPRAWPRNALTLLRTDGRDPGLLTLKGLRALHEADALIYDTRLHMETVLSMGRRDAERIPVELISNMVSEAMRGKLISTIQDHGRVVLLLTPGDNAPDFASGMAELVRALERSGVPVEKQP